MVQSSRLVPLQLFLRLVMPDPYTSDRGQIWWEQMPNDLPVELPLPNRFRIIVSLQQKNTFFAILIQVPQSPSRIKCWYSNRLRALGWHQWQSSEIFLDWNSFVISGSASNNSPTPLLTFCYPSKPFTLTLQTCPIAENDTYIQLRITANREFRSPCQASWERNAFNLIPQPQLVSPHNTEVKKKRAGGSNSEWLNEAKIQTSLNSLALFAHYNTQLAQAGWSQQTIEDQKELLWNVWRLEDVYKQVWQLVFSLIAENNNKGNYRAYLQILNLKDLERVWFPAKVEQIDSTEMIPEEILRQFLSNDLSPNRKIKQLLIGEFPTLISNTLQFPESTKILGSLVQEDNQFSLFLEIDLLPDQIYEYFTEQLIDLGWQECNILKEVENFGFATSRLPRLTITEFFNPTDGIRFLVRLYSTTSNCTDVRLRWLPRSEPEFEPLEESNQSTLEERLNQTPIPTLKLPKQTEVVKGPSNIHELRFRKIVFINTSLLAEVLANHYKTEMQQAGWQQLATSQKQKHHFSIWFFTDEQGQSWQGILNLLPVEGETNKYIGQLRIELLDSLDSTV